MKSVFLSVVIICALAVAGVGGTLAGYSDTEESFGNYVKTGSLDLVVLNPQTGIYENDEPWGNGIGTPIALEKVMPDKEYTVTVWVANVGESAEPNGDPEEGWLYLELKDLMCTNAKPIHYAYAYDEPPDEGTWDWNPKQVTMESLLKPEPEVVAEYGGQLAQQDIVGPAWTGMLDGDETNNNDAVGQLGEDCCLTTHMELTINYRGTTPFSGKINLTQEGTDPKQIYIGRLPPCGTPVPITFKFKLQQVKYTDITGGTWTGHEKFDYWPTNAFMVDKLKFDILFELLQEEYIEPVG